MRKHIFELFASAEGGDGVFPEQRELLGGHGFLDVFPGDPLPGAAFHRFGHIISGESLPSRRIA